MKAEQVLRRVLESLESVGISYVVVGSFATNVYGIAGRRKTRISSCRLDRAGWRS